MEQLVKVLLKVSDHIVFVRKYIDLSVIIGKWVSKNNNKRTQENQRELQRDKKKYRQDRGDQNATPHSEAKSATNLDISPKLKQIKRICNLCGRPHKPPCRLVNDPLANKNPTHPWAESARGKYLASLGYSDSRLTTIHLFISIKDKRFETHMCLLDDGAYFR